MKNSCMYFAKNEIYEKIRSIGGEWNDPKERPIVCLIESTERKGLYWAIPVGNWEHRDKNGKARIQSYIDRPSDDLRSCYYHIGRTTVKSIFFISKAIPITARYVDREYLGYDKNPYVIKNKKLLKTLGDKLKRILKMEATRNNYFQQNITDIKNLLISELEADDIDYLL